jgi:CDP-diacylglycerol pyrophosphatase
LICAVVVGLVLVATRYVGPRDALWIIVHDQCVPHEIATRSPRPCTAVDLTHGVDRGFAVLKDVRGASHFLVVPTARISGIESPAVLAPDAPNYFEDAWEARVFVDSALHRALPREDIGLAINSIADRSQDQLHIHVDCVRQSVHDSLSAHMSEIGDQWVPLPFKLSWHHYQAIWVSGDSLGSTSPFQLLVSRMPSAREDMGDRTLVVIGAARPDGSPGFIVLENLRHSERHNSAHGEELLDHDCRGRGGAATERGDS